MAVKQSNTTTGIRNITIAHATVQALHMLKEDASGSSRTVRSAKQCSTRIVQRKSTRDQPWIWQAAWQAPWDPVRQFWKWSDDDFSNHWQSLTYNTLMFRWYSSRFALRFKKWPPAITFCQVTSQRAVFSAKTTKSLGRKNKFLTSGWKVAGLLLCLLVCESASCLFYGRAGKPITDQYQSSV